VIAARVDASRNQPRLTTDGVDEGRWSALPLVLVVVVLIASVLIPARETWRIMQLLRETTEVIEPARVLVARLEFGLTVESAALERYALSRDSGQRARYIAAQDENRRLAAIEDLAPMLDASAVSRAIMTRNSIGRWREISRTIVDEKLSPEELATAMQVQHARYQVALEEVERLGAYLASEGNARRELIRGSERLSLVVNAALVLVALAAVFAVARLRQRERLLTRILRHRVDEEAALAHEKLRLLDEAREGRQQLERVMQSRSRLMRGFSHDVKNPLGAADGYAELLTAGVYGTLSDAQRESVTRLRRSIRSALDLIDDLHEMARAETGNINVSLKLVDLAELVRGSGDEYRAAAEASGLSLSVDAGESPLVIETDRIRVRQILSNLLSNAIKYTAHGSVGLRVRRELAQSAADGNGWLLVDVRDTGVGIAPDKWEAIFDEFVRLGANEKSGAGLGLAVSQRLAHALGGRITVESEVGRGSTFTLHLPFHHGNATVPGASPIAGLATAPPHSPDVLFRRCARIAASPARPASATATRRRERSVPTTG
jgi:signal transduction histidine kinase